MKILIVSVVQGSSVDRLADMVQKYNEHLDIKILPFHAKRYSEDDLEIFEEMAKDVDLIDFEYWRGAEVLMKVFPWVKEKKKILTHHNPYDLDKIDPKLFDKVVVKNKTQQEALPGSVYVPHAVDMGFFEFNESYNADGKVVNMVAYRIESKKGIREVAQACKELGYKLLLVGHVSKPDYMRQVAEIGKGMNFEFREDATDEELRDAYYQSTIHVCNSVDNFESGTMPILEAIACGVPVLTRYIGLVPDAYNLENMVVRKGQSEDVEDLKTELKELMENKEKRLAMREAGWRTAKEYNDWRMAKKFALVYNLAMFPTRPLISVITATYNRQKQVLEIVEALNEQTYKNMELVVCDDNSMDGTEEAVKSMREKVSFPIKYLNTEKDGYNLAMARNLGAIEADGQFLMFLDSRLLPEKDAVEKMIQGLCGVEHKLQAEKVWVFGDKGAGKKSFVENFSAVRRLLFIRAGMFNERIDKYGGMSQEIRERFGTQEFKMVYLENAKAKEILRAQGISKKRKDILEMKNLLWKMGYWREK